MQIKICKICGKTLSNRRNKYCSRKCYYKSELKGKEVKCSYCGKCIWRSPKELKRNKRGNFFCNIECISKYETGNNNFGGRFKERSNCLTCGKKLKELKRKYCSIECRIHKDVEKICDECGNIFKVKYLFRNSQKFCSRKCADINHGKKMSGRNNSNYNTGHYCEGFRYYYGAGWSKSLKQKIRDRDNFTCQMCGKLEINNGKNLSVHHIDYIKSNMNDDNLISLCKNCHAKVHGKNEKRALWKEKLLNLLKR